MRKLLYGGNILRNEWAELYKKYISGNDMGFTKIQQHSVHTCYLALQNQPSTMRKITRERNLYESVDAYAETSEQCRAE